MNPPVRCNDCRKMIPKPRPDGSGMCRYHLCVDIQRKNRRRKND